MMSSHSFDNGWKEINEPIRDIHDPRIDSLESRGSYPFIGWILGGASILVVVLLLLNGRNLTRSAPEEIPLSAVGGDPSVYMGRNIVVFGQIKSVLAPGVFLLGRKGQPSEVVVIDSASRDLPPGTVDGTRAGWLRVQGPLRRFGTRDMDTRRVADRNLTEQWVGRPVIAAESVTALVAE